MTDQEMLIRGVPKSEAAAPGQSLTVAHEPFTVHFDDGTFDQHARYWDLTNDGSRDATHFSENGRQSYETGPNGELRVIASIQGITGEPKDRRRYSRREEVKVYAAGSWIAVTGGQQAPAPTGDMLPGDGWWARLAPFPYDAERLRYAPVIAWERVSGPDGVKLHAWLGGTAPVRSDGLPEYYRETFEEKPLRVTGYVREIPDEDAERPRTLN